MSITYADVLRLEKTHRPSADFVEWMTTGGIVVRLRGRKHRMRARRWLTEGRKTVRRGTDIAHDDTNGRG